MKNNKILFFVLGALVFSLSACNASNENSGGLYGPTPGHEHTYSSTWNYDSTYHWHDAACGHDVVSNKERHTFNDVITDPTYSSGGYTTHTCTVCGYSYTDSETFLVTFIKNGIIVYNEIVAKGSQPYKYYFALSNSYYWLKLFSDEDCTKNYTVSNIYSNTVIFVQRVLNPYPIVSENKTTKMYSSSYSNNDILNYVIINSWCTYYEPAYLKIHINVGEVVVITTNTTYQKMNETLMLSLAGDRGQALNGGSFTRFQRTMDSYKHNILIMSVNKSGDYYIAVTYTPNAIAEFGVSFLSSFRYVFDITATINNGFLLD